MDQVPRPLAARDRDALDNAFRDPVLDAGVMKTRSLGEFTDRYPRAAGWVGRSQFGQVLGCRPEELEDRTRTEDALVSGT